MLYFWSWRLSRSFFKWCIRVSNSSTSIWIVPLLGCGTFHVSLPCIPLLRVRSNGDFTKCIPSRQMEYHDMLDIPHLPGRVLTYRDILLYAPDRSISRLIVR